MDTEQPKMLYRYLGDSGMRVSAIGWGNWINTGDANATHDIMKYAIESGVNYFDTAEAYNNGEAEKTMGNALKKLDVRREDLVISTKIFKCGGGVNDNLLSRKHVIEGVNNSLKRLQLDYVDIIFCHKYDYNINMEEVCRAMNHLIEKEKAFCWGVSEWRASQIMEAHVICEKLGLIKPVTEQCQYNMLERYKWNLNTLIYSKNIVWELLATHL